MNELMVTARGRASSQLNWHDDVMIKQLLSYAIGCMMGRYSVDKPGLILASQGEGVEEYEERVYGARGRTPSQRFEVDDDGIIPVMAADCEFTDNAPLRMKMWLATVFGTETLNENLNYIAYLHRMDAYTLERIRTKYLLPHIEHLVSLRDEMQANAANLSTRERKQLDTIVKQIEECREYHDRLHVIADLQQPLDLELGVVANYAKLGDVVAKLK